jgi:DNA-binding NarL/FixJ family response regulator
MPCFNSVPDDVFKATRVRSLFTEPYLSMIFDAIEMLRGMGVALTPALQQWERDASQMRNSVLKEDSDSDQLAQSYRYQMAYAHRSFTASLLCDALWQIIEGGGHLPDSCRDWWGDHLMRDRVDPGQGRPDRAMPPEDLELLYQRERDLFRQFWINQEP